MPTYLYVCDKCEDRKEEDFSILNYPQEISCLKGDCLGKKKLTVQPSNYKINGNNDGSTAKRMKK